MSGLIQKVNLGLSFKVISPYTWISRTPSISAIAFEAEKTIVLEKDSIIKGCNANNIALIGL